MFWRFFCRHLWYLFFTAQTAAMFKAEKNETIVAHSGLGTIKAVYSYSWCNLYCYILSIIVLCRVCFALGQAVGSSEYLEYKCYGSVPFSPASKLDKPLSYSMKPGYDAYMHKQKKLDT